MAAETMTTAGVLVVTECPACFIPHAVPKRLYEDRLANGGEICCPRGHRWVFCESETAKLKRELADAQRRRDAALTARNAALDQAEAAQRSAAAYKGQVTRIRNRAGAGVCPADGCHRHFQDLARHMAARHPEFRESD